MSKPKFSKPPISEEERERKVEDFINSSHKNTAQKKHMEEFKREASKPIYLRAPESLWKDVHEIMARTGLSMNAICLEILRPALKKKLRELQSE